MKYYKSYMERQELSPERREQLLALGRENRPAARPVRRWRGMAALAACCALLVGVGLGVWRDSARPAPVEEPARETMQAISDSAAFRSMPLYPADGSVKILDGRVVVRVQEQYTPKSDYEIAYENRR